jgi:hypothetical protein
MMPSGIPMMSVPFGPRQRRFMESSDFNGAAKYIFSGLRLAVAEGNAFRGVAFFTVEMDPASAGEVASTAAVSLTQAGLAHAMREHEDVATALSAGLNHLLGRPDGHADLAVVVASTGAIDASTEDWDEAPYSVSVEVRSCDASAVAKFRVIRDAGSKSRLEFSPLVFRGRASI